MYITLFNVIFHVVTFLNGLASVFVLRVIKTKRPILLLRKSLSLSLSRTTFRTFSTWEKYENRISRSLCVIDAVITMVIIISRHYNYNLSHQIRAMYDFRLNENK